MEAEARYTYVGAAVVALLLALVAAFVWLKDVGARDRYTRYAIYFERQRLDGLEVGAGVDLRGIKIGRVDDYGLSGDKVSRVRVVVRIDRRVPVLTNTAAIVTRNLVTGIAGITLVNRKPAGPPLVAVPAGEDYPVIAEGQSDLDEIAGRVQQLGQLASDALANLNLLLTPANRAAVIDTVHNLRDLSAGLNRRLPVLDRALDHSADAAARIGLAADRVGQAGQRVAAVAESAGAQLGDATARTVAAAELSGQRLDAALLQAERTLADARVAIDRLSSSVDAVQRQASASAQRIEDTASDVDDQVGAAMVELRLSIESASHVVDRLRDPRATLLGPSRAQLGPGEGRP